MPSILRTLLLPFLAMVFCISKAAVFLKGILKVFSKGETEIRFLKSKALAFTFLSAAVMLATNAFSQQETFSDPLKNGTTNKWIAPSGVYKVTVEVWGAGGAGGGATGTNNRVGGGGGGGAYRKVTNIDVVPGMTYDVTVAAGGVPDPSYGKGGNGGSSSATFGVVTVTAAGGNGGIGATLNHGAGGAGGKGGTFNGGNGFGFNSGNQMLGGGGGSSAGTNSNGNDATGSTGASAVPGGGKGGDGLNASVGQAGSNPGGGGAGGVRSSSTDRIGGAGGNGQVIISWVVCPTAGTLSGVQAVCINNTTAFSSTTSGGTWSSNDANVATVNSSTGVITGKGVGTATITYTIAASGSCPEASAIRTVSVTTVPSQPDAFTTSTATVFKGQTGVIYTISPVSGANSYTWSYSGSGANINGTGTSISVAYNNTATSGTLSVTAINSCGASVARTMSIMVNTKPVANGQTITLNEDETYTGSLNGTDEDGNALTYSTLENEGPSNGTISYNGSTGAFTYTPNANFYGQDAFKFKVNDGSHDSEPVTVTINVISVNDAPVLTVPAQPSNINELTAWSFTASATDGDEPANTLTFSLVDAPQGASINPTTGVFSWTPAENQDGSHTFKVSVSDGNGGIDEETITVTVDEVNSAPQGAHKTITIDEDASHAFNASDFGFSDPSDIPANTLKAVKITTLPNNGELRLNNVAVTAGQFISTVNIGNLSFIPVANANGSPYATFTFQVQDNGGTAFGGSDLDATPNTITINVTPVNDKPVLSALQTPVTIDEEVLYTFTASASDVENDELSFSLQGVVPSGATINPTTGLFSWTPDETQGPGSYTFKVRVTDNGTPNEYAEQTITINVSEVNVAPVLDPVGNKTIAEMTNLTFTATATDQDRPNNTLTFSLIGAPTGASINGSTGVFNWTPTEMQGPNTFTFKVRATDNGAGNLYDEEEITVTVDEVNVKPVITDVPPTASVKWGNNLTFDVNATDSDIPANVLTFSLIGAPTGATIDAVTGVFNWTPAANQRNGSPYTFTVRVTDDGVGNLYDEKQIIIVVNKRNSKVVFNGVNSKQYSDEASLTATLTDITNGTSITNIAGKSVVITVGTQNANGTTASDGIVSTTMIITQSKGNKNAFASFAGDDYYEPSTSATSTFIVDAEDARIDYTGDQIMATASSSTTTATVTLRANILDITAVTGDPSTDPYAGDIRNARVKFVNRETGTDLSGWLTPTLVVAGNMQVGTVSAPYSVNLGTGDAVSTTVGIVVSNGGYYERSTTGDDVVVTVYKPNGDFITGGGHIVVSKSEGSMKADVGSKTNFGFNVKFNKTGKNLLGQLNFIFRRTESDGKVHVYQVKSNAMETLGVNVTNANSKTANFVSKCNITDITNPLAPVSVGGNRKMYVTMVDNGEPGANDIISFVLVDGNNDPTILRNILYSSNWTGVKTEMINLRGGNLVVRSGYNLGSTSTAIKNDIQARPQQVEAASTTAFNLTAFPNPSANLFNVKLESSNNAEKIVVRVIDLQGRTIEVFNNLVPGQTMQIGSNYRPGVYFVEMIQGANRKQLQLIKRIN